MNIVYRLEGVAFEWDERKAQSNIEKHGVTFEQAAEAFFDPFYQTGDASVDDEQRDFILGYSMTNTFCGCIYRTRRADKNNFGAPCHPI